MPLQKTIAVWSWDLPDQIHNEQVSRSSFQFPQVISHILYIDTSESYDLFIFNLWQFLDRVEGEEMEILLFQLNNIHALLVW